jgi:DNA-binding transcriptional MerR regulator
MTKGPEAFRTISEAADEVGVAPHVLRFWETRFSVIRPMKRAGGRRFYRPQDVALLRSLRTLLHDHGRSIRDVQQMCRREGVKALHALAGPIAAAPEASIALAAALPQIAPKPSQPPPDEGGRARLAATREDLIAIKLRLDALLAG